MSRSRSKNQSAASILKVAIGLAFNLYTGSIRIFRNIPSSALNNSILFSRYFVLFRNGESDAQSESVKLLRSIGCTSDGDRRHELLGKASSLLFGFCMDTTVDDSARFSILQTLKEVSVRCRSDTGSSFVLCILAARNYETFPSCFGDQNIA